MKLSSDNFGTNQFWKNKDEKTKLSLGYCHALASLGHATQEPDLLAFPVTKSFYLHYGIVMNYASSYQQTQ